VNLAIFDLDNTLIAGDSDHGWGEFLVEHQLVDVDAYKRANDQFYEDYERGELDIKAYLEFSLAPLTHYSQEELAELHQRFMKERIEPLKLTKASELLQKHRNQGDYLLIITSTNRFITQPIADSLGVDHLLATEAEIVDGRYSGRMQGVPCYQEGKITRLHAWLETAAEHGFNGNLENSYFYSDSINDAPLLKVVDHPVAVDADEALTELAQQQGWDIISLRD